MVLQRVAKLKRLGKVVLCCGATNTVHHENAGASSSFNSSGASFDSKVGFARVYFARVSVELL